MRTYYLVPDGSPDVPENFYCRVFSEREFQSLRQVTSTLEDIAASYRRQADLTLRLARRARKDTRYWMLDAARLRSTAKRYKAMAEAQLAAVNAALKCCSEATIQDFAELTRYRVDGGVSLPQGFGVTLKSPAASVYA